MKKKIYTDNRGFTTSDIIIAVIIIVLFISIITSSFYNYYISIQAKNRRTIATNSIIDVIENTEMLKYEDVTQEKVDEIIENLIQDGTIPTGYTITAVLEKYTEIEGNENKKDVIKILKVNAKYILSDKEESLEIKRLITK